MRCGKTLKTCFASTKTQKSSNLIMNSARLLKVNLMFLLIALVSSLLLICLIISTLLCLKNLVAYAINGLNPKFERVATIIRHNKPLSSFLETRSMLMAQEHRIKQLDHLLTPSATPSSPTVLVVEQHNSSQNTTHGGFNHHGGRNDGRGRGHNNHGGGRWSHSTDQTLQAPPGWGFGWYPLQTGQGLLPRPYMGWNEEIIYEELEYESNIGNRRLEGENMKGFYYRVFDREAYD